MIRIDIIERVGRKYLQSNIENDEYSYCQGLKDIGKNYKDYMLPNAKRNYKDLDIRFADSKISILIEAKNNFDKWNKKEIYEQLQHYINYEKELTGNKIVAIIANTNDNRTLMWYGSNPTISDDNVIKNKPILSFHEYSDMFFCVTNNKHKVIQSTYELNELLHESGIGEKIRSQFVGTCLLALKNGLTFEKQTTRQIIGGIEDILTNLLDKNLNKAEKLTILKVKVLESQDVRDLTADEFIRILNKIKKEILPYINDKSTMGQDLLNLFFTTFNKYVGKTDKNQAFTPDHIVHFMCNVVNINRNSRVLDPCCGSGAFLVRALTEAMDDCDEEEEKDIVKKQQIYGIEYDEVAFGLSTTNMLIHGDGNSNVVQGSCFDKEQFINEANINVVLMNPPYNAQKKNCYSEYVKTWTSTTKEDPSKGFHYVYYIASKVKTGKLAVLLPMSCAIGTSSEIKKFKELMLEEHTLDAVFSLPNDIFHPGAAAIACCMVFNLGTRHKNAPLKETFFGYFKDDGFKKKKNLGRIEKVDENGNGLWNDIQNEWLRLYRNRETKIGFSVTKEVTANDEWLAEAYMDTDYSKLNQKDFEKVLNEYLGYLISNAER